MTIIMVNAARLTFPVPLTRKKIGTPMSAAEPKQISCRFVRLKNTFVFTLVRSRGTGIYAATENLLPLVGREHALCKRTGLKEGEAQKNRVSHDTPDRSDNVLAESDRLHQHRIDAHTDHNQEPLEPDCKK